MDYPLLWVIGERRIRARVFYQEVEQYTVTDGPHFSASRPGRGRRLHVGATVCQGETDLATWLSVDDDRYTEARIMGETVAWTRLPDTPDGGKVFTGETKRRGRWTMTFYHLADGSQLSSLHDAAARALAQHGENLSFPETSKGYGVTMVHMTFDQPPFGDQPGIEVIAGDPFAIVWPENSAGPQVEIGLRGSRLRVPTRGLPADQWPVEFSSNWAAAEFWLSHEHEGVPLRNINLESFIEAAEIADTEIEVDSNDGLCRVRWQYRATTNRVRPAMPDGNAFPAGAPWYSTREDAIAAVSGAAHIWYSLSWFIDGLWLNWGAALYIGPVGSGGAADPLTRNEQFVVRSTRSTGRGSVTKFSTDPASVVSAFGAPDPGDIDPCGDGQGDDDDDDRCHPGTGTDPGVNPDVPGNPLPPGINPGDPADTYCQQFDRDKTVRLYEVNGIVSSDDGLQRIRDEMGFAGSGSVVSNGGVLHAMPGWDREPVAHIDATHADINVESYRASPPLSERVNASSMRLANSRVHNFEAYTTPVIRDEARIAEDGKVIFRDWGTRAFMTSPTGANIVNRHNLTEARPWKVVGYRVPIEYSRSLRHALPGERITVNDPEHDLYPIISRATDSPLYQYGDSRGRYMRIIGRAFNFDDDQTMSIVVMEHPNGMFAPSLDFPGLRPDPSAPGAFVEQPTGLALEEETYRTDDNTIRSRIVGTSDLAAVAKRIVQWRPVVPGGVGDTAYTTLVTRDGRGREREITTTPDWGGHRQVVIDGSDFTIDEVRIGVTYEVRLIDQSRLGVDSEPSDSATITLTGASTGDTTQWAATITRAMRATNGIGADDWHLGGDNLAWTGGERTLAIVAVTPTEEALLNRLDPNALISLYGDGDNWSICRVTTAPTFTGSGAARRLAMGVTATASSGKQTAGQLSIRFFPSGIDGPDLAGELSFSLNTIGGMSLEWHDPPTPPDLWLVQIGLPTEDGGIDWAGTPQWVDGGETSFRSGDTPISGPDPLSASDLATIYGNTALSNRMYVRVQGLRRDGNAVIGYGASTTSSLIELGTLSPVSPRAVTAVVTDAIAPGSITVTVQAVPQATSYPIERQIGAGQWTQVQNGAGRTFIDSNLAAGTYRYRAAAMNAAGTSAYTTSPIRTITTSTSSPSLRVVIIGGGRSFFYGSNVTMNADVRGSATGAITYAWRRVGSSTIIGSSAEITVTLPGSGDSISYSVTVTRSGLTATDTTTIGLLAELVPPGAPTLTGLSAAWNAAQLRIELGVSWTASAQGGPVELWDVQYWNSIDWISEHWVTGPAPAWSGTFYVGNSTKPRTMTVRIVARSTNGDASSGSMTVVVSG